MREQGVEPASPVPPALGKDRVIQAVREVLLIEGRLVIRRARTTPVGDAVLEGLALVPEVPAFAAPAVVEAGEVLLTGLPLLVARAVGEGG